MIAAVVGEGGSGGAIALAAANRVLMFEHAVYSVISPEGCASILWRTADKAADAAEAMRVTAQQLAELKVIDRIVPEPLGGAHRDPAAAIAALEGGAGRGARPLRRHERRAIARAAARQVPRARRLELRGTVSEPHRSSSALNGIDCPFGTEMIDACVSRLFLAATALATSGVAIAQMRGAQPARRRRSAAPASADWSRNSAAPRPARAAPMSTASGGASRPLRGSAARALRFTALNSAVENAFALPGGYVYITRQLMGLMNDEAELGFVLGHETGHIAAQPCAGAQVGVARNSILGVLGAVLGVGGRRQRDRQPASRRARNCAR